MRRAVSARPVSWLAPPVSTTRLPTCSEKPDRASMSRVISSVSSMRGRMMRVSAERGTVLGWSRSSSPTGGMVKMSFSSESEGSAEPWRALMRSASARLVESPRAMSSVTCWPPTAIASACTNSPLWKIDSVVVPPPMSISATPSCASSSTSAARPDA